MVAFIALFICVKIVNYTAAGVLIFQASTARRTALAGCPSSPGVALVAFPVAPHNSHLTLKK